MADRTQTRQTLIGVLVLAALAFLPGINWGLPSRAADPYLFGVETPWQGDRIVFLSGAWRDDSNVAADVDRNPITQRNQPVLLNASNAQRAEIIRRFRLYSYQPDEMITLRAIGQMNVEEGQLDPKLYQYGGLWIYPVAAMLKAAMVVRFIPSPPTGVSALVYYIDHPEAFGRFYIVARLYAALWGLVAVWAVFYLVRRLTGDNLIAGAGALAFAIMPVVVNLAHEAKPHLPGCALMLLAIIAALRYIDTGKPKWWLGAGALCGAAVGMVLSALPVFLILPVMVWLRRSEKLPRKVAVAAGAIGVGVGVYLVSNPYVLINLLTNRRILQSNFSNLSGNRITSPHASGWGLLNAVVLVAQGTSPLLALLGVAGAVTLMVWKRRGGAVATGGGVPCLVLAPAAAIAIQFALLAAGKPGEYARFGLFVDVALVILAAWAVGTVASNLMYRQLLAALIVVTALPYGLAYCRAFIRDASKTTTRLEAAEELSHLRGRILLHSEPAPYNCPPVDLFRRDLVLVPEGNAPAYAQGDDLVVSAVDTPVGNAPEGPRRLPLSAAPGAIDQFTTPIAWANKTFAYQISATKKAGPP